MLSVLFALLIHCTGAFVVPRPFASPLQAIPPAFSTLTLSDSELDTVTSQGASIVEQAGGVLTNIAIVVTGILGLLLGLTFLYASVIIPQAAEQLEKEAEELAPDLWKETKALLNEGETIAQRPDLMQELGEKLRPRLEQKYAAQQQMSQQPPSQEMTLLSPPPVSKDDLKIVDAEIVTEDNSKN